MVLLSTTARNAALIRRKIPMLTCVMRLAPPSLQAHAGAQAHAIGCHPRLVDLYVC